MSFTAPHTLPGLTLDPHWYRRAVFYEVMVRSFVDSNGDGCPDVVPPELSELAGIMEGITFDTDKASIKQSSENQLDNAVDVMKRYPDIRVMVTGHTDAQGGYRHNVDLSRRRADAVRDYMVGKGVDAKRIETRGVGPDEPISTNDTAEGRSLNRRIEFTILGEDGPVKAKK